MENITKNNRLLWADITRIIAIIAVVAIHVEDSFIFSWNQITWTDWWASNVYNGFIRFPVPLFIILSGYLLLDKQEDDRVFFSKRFSKVVLPLLAWSMVYWLFTHDYKVHSLFSTTFIQGLLSDDIFYHLYFLYIIVGLYLITPLLRRILVHVSSYEMKYYLALWLFFVPINYTLEFFGYNIGVHVEAVTLNLGLYLMGYFVKKTRITNNIVLFSVLLVAASILVTIIGTYILIKNNGDAKNSMNSLFVLTSITFAIGLFILIRESSSRFSFSIFSKSESLITAISGATLGIYLVHPMLLSFIRNGVFELHLLSVNEISPILSVPSVTLLLVISSLIIVLILQKIPVLRMIVP